MSTEKRVREIVARFLLPAGAEPSQKEIDPDKDLFRELGIKSSAALELLLSLEDEFGRSISDEDFNEARTISALARLMA